MPRSPRQTTEIVSWSTARPAEWVPSRSSSPRPGAPTSPPSTRRGSTTLVRRARCRPGHRLHRRGLHPRQRALGPGLRHTRQPLLRGQPSRHRRRWHLHPHRPRRVRSGRSPLGGQHPAHVRADGTLGRHARAARRLDEGAGQATGHGHPDGLSASGQLRTVIDRTFPFAETPAALRYLTSGQAGRARRGRRLTTDSAGVGQTLDPLRDGHLPDPAEPPSGSERRRRTSRAPPTAMRERPRAAARRRAARKRRSRSTPAPSRRRSPTRRGGFISRVRRIWKARRGRRRGSAPCAPARAAGRVP